MGRTEGHVGHVACVRERRAAEAIDAELDATDTQTDKRALAGTPLVRVLRRVRRDNVREDMVAVVLIAAVLGGDPTLRSWPKRRRERCLGANTRLHPERIAKRECRLQHGRRALEERALALRASRPGA